LDKLEKIREIELRIAEIQQEREKQHLFMLENPSYIDSVNITQTELKEELEELKTKKYNLVFGWAMLTFNGNSQTSKDVQENMWNVYFDRYDTEIRKVLADARHCGYLDSIDGTYRITDEGKQRFSDKN